ncbi:integrase [Brevibacillus sp. MER 51]|uniref:integrase n=1 Tax=Brevibacillus sp. MER 51 TaxID=2939560 RepID=UPI00203B2827|nr:integrase [Brevibacillus sp. MER 51]MCM3144383.1 integrase [Brevibacillus sp. MER 51]
MTYQKQTHVNRFVDRPNTYVLQENGDGTVTISPAWQQIAGTPVDEFRLNHMEDGIEGAHLLYARLERRVTRVEAYLDLDSHDVEGAQARFADTYDGVDDPVLKLDQTKTYATTALTAKPSSTTVTVASTTAFTLGQEVTICDDVAFENQKITAIGTGTISFASLTNNYKKGALIGRSTIYRDAAAQKMRIGGWGTHTVTITQV